MLHLRKCDAGGGNSVFLSFRVPSGVVGATDSRLDAVRVFVMQLEVIRV